MNNFCPACGNKITEDSQFCVNCGYNLIQTSSNNIENLSDGNNQSTNNQMNTNFGQQTSAYTNSIGITGFVISLVSWFFCCGSLSWLSLIFSIIGLKNAKKNNGVGKGLSIAGIVISAIGLAIIIIYLFLMMFTFMVNVGY